MQGRRRSVRFSLSNSEGVLSVVRDVVVQRTEAGTLVVVDTQPRQVGELLTIDTMVNNEVVTLAVTVIASRAFVRSGAVLHEVVMRPVEESR